MKQAAGDHNLTTGRLRIFHSVYLLRQSELLKETNCVLNSPGVIEDLTHLTLVNTL